MELINMEDKTEPPITSDVMEKDIAVELKRPLLN